MPDSQTQPNRSPVSQTFLAKDLYVIVTTPVVSREELDKVLPQHLAHQVDIEKRGILFGAGPMFDKDGKGFAGLIIIRADSFEEADKIAMEDPFHAKGLRTYTLNRWRMNEGTITVRVDYSDQTMTLT